MNMLGRRTLLINPPLINGVAFTRQGRCQEREDVLGTTKPPYTLALLATLLRDAGCEGCAPWLILFPARTPALGAGGAEVGKLKTRGGAGMFGCGRRASAAAV